jgi:hypothetical protein
MREPQPITPEAITRHYMQGPGCRDSPERASRRLKTRRGTGFYKVPSLQGVWFRSALGHGGQAGRLEEWFDPARLKSDYVPLPIEAMGRLRLGARALENAAKFPPVGRD